MSVLIPITNLHPVRVSEGVGTGSFNPNTRPLLQIGILDLHLLWRSPSSTTKAENFFWLVGQPAEIIDAILLHIDSLKDPSNNDLDSKCLYDVVFPPGIYLSVASISVWSYPVHHRL
jgi:hypothetical protein